MERVAKIVGGSLLKLDTGEHRSAKGGVADIEHNKDKPPIKGHSFDEQTDMVFNAIQSARRMLDAGFSSLMGVDSLPERTVDALASNFHNVDRSQAPTRITKLDEIRESIAKTVRPFNEEIPIEIESSQDDKSTTLGYVKVRPIFGHYGSIHLMPLWFTEDPDYRAQVVVHEACHRFDEDSDHAYKWETDKYSHLSADDSIDNADSYAWFCDEVNK